MLDKLLATALNPILDRMGVGWKAALGLLAMLVVLVLHLLGHLTADEYEMWFNYAVLVFGIGIYHAKISEPTKPPQG